LSKTSALRREISNFYQTSLESTPEAWERLQDLVRACPHHGMEDWLVLQNFYEGLTTISMEHLNTTARGAFLSLTIENATTLIIKIVANQSWGEGRETQDDMCSAKETGLLATKVDLRIKRLDDHATKLTKGTVQTMGSHMNCEVCGDVGHFGNNCPET